MMDRWTSQDCKAWPVGSSAVAMVDGPWSGGRGSCLRCGETLIAKCGPRVKAHWAHRPSIDWDPWGENETAWHRAWKARFPTDWHEISLIDERTGEVHRADLRSPNGVFIEVQNSPMNDAERQSRELFYKNLVWIVNGTPFLPQFRIVHKLPDPASDLAADLVWFPAKHDEPGTHDGICWRKSKNPGIDGKRSSMVLLEHWHRIEKEIEPLYRGHRQFVWIRARAGWLDATCPVFLDFGGPVLWRIERYDTRSLRSVRAVSKDQFVSEAMSAESAASMCMS